MSDVHSLIKLLSTLANPSTPDALTKGTARLQQFYTSPGFYNNLHQIAFSTEVPRDTRVLAGLCLKNEMLVRWRGKTVLSEEEKVEIRSRLLSFLEETDPSIAQVQFFILSKVSRLDFPRAWPDLMQRLVDVLVPSANSRIASASTAVSATSPDRIVLRNCLWCLNRVVKEWASFKLPLGTKVMGEFVQLLIPILLPLLGALVDLPHDVDIPEDTESAMLCFKIVSRLSVWEWAKPAPQRLPDAAERITNVFQITTSHLTSVISTRSSLLSHLRTSQTPSGGRLMLKYLSKHVGALIKHIRRLEDTNPKGFSSIPGANEVVLQLWGNVKATLGNSSYDSSADQETSDFPERWIILSLLVFKDLLPIWTAIHPQVLEVPLISEAFALVTERMLLLTAADMELLADDSEEWVIAETAQNEQWTYNLRACGERLLMALNNACRNRTDQIMQHLMQAKLVEAMSTPIVDEDSLRRKEAVYTASGRLARSLVENQTIPLDQFLAALAGEAKSSSPDHRVLKRRIAWLVGELVDAHEDLASGPLPWELLLGLVQDHGESSDVGVRLTACTALKQAMDLWEMEASCFKEYIPRITDGLMVLLLDELQLLDGKRRVLDALEVMIERVGEDIVPLLTQISDCVPQLWERASNQEGEWLFKSSLLSLVTKMVDAAKTEANRLCPLCVGLLGESLQGTAKLHLEEDGLILWQSLVRNASVLEPQLIELASVAIGQLSSDPDSLSRSLAIVDSYALICGVELYQTFASQLAEAFKAIFFTSTPSDAVDIITSIALHIDIVPVSSWGPAFVSSGLISKIFTDANLANVGAKLPPYSSLFAKMILADPATFLDLLGAAGVQKSAFLDFWWAAFDRIASPSIRKRVALASASLCSTGDDEVLQRFAGEFVNLFIDVLAELKEQSEEGGDRVDIKLLWKRNNDAPDMGDSEGTAEGTRRKALFETDPVYTASLKEFLRVKLAQTPGLSSYVDVADPAFVELQGYLASA
ncbi:armadillo-type protein [Mrakia frigida]|uniref:karyopherin KAP120 n=1 Tax=Mrakia frigida TaxID=29902 RepID=UPI003FCBF86D